MVYSMHKLETFQRLGPVIRVHWNHEQVTKDGMEYWSCEEIVVPADITVEELEVILKEHGQEHLMEEFT
jgi:hypothetical protein